MKKIVFLLFSILLSSCVGQQTIEGEFRGSINGTEGAWYVRADGDVDIRPIVTETLSVTPSLTPTSSQVVTVFPTDTATATLTPTLTPTETDSNEVTLPARVETNVRINLRDDPSGRIVRVLPIGTVGVATESVFESGYLRYRIELSDGTVGWAAQNSEETWLSFSELNITPTNTPSPTETETFDPTPTREVAQGDSNLTIHQVGFNYNAVNVPEYQNAIDVGTSVCANGAGHLVMNGIGMANELVEEGCDPRNIVIRFYHVCEGGAWLCVTPRQVINIFCNASEQTPYARDFVWESPANEPSYGGEQSTSDYVNWMVEVMRIGADSPCGIDFRIGAGAFGVGKFTKSDINSGEYDPMLRAVVEYGDVITVHEYTVGSVCIGMGTCSGQLIYDAAIGDDFAREHLSKIWCPSPSQFYNNPKWHIGRYHWFVERAQEIGLNTPIEFMITEWLFDTMQDVKARRGSEIVSLNDIFRDRYNVDFRGVNSYTGFARDAFGWSLSEFIENQMRCMASQYPRYIEGEQSGVSFAAVFSWTSARGWRTFWTWTDAWDSVHRAMLQQS